MRHKFLKVFSISLIAGFFMNQHTKGCDDLVSISSMLSSDSEIKIEKKELNQCFIDSWIDDIEKSSKTVFFGKINAITIENCKLNKEVSYDIFNSFVNIKELNIINCCIDSKELNNLLTYINPHSLSILNLSGSSFYFFDEKDFVGINSLFSLSKIILPLDMDKSSRRTLEELFDQPMLIDQPVFSQQDEVRRITIKIAEYERKADELRKLLEKLQINPQELTDDQIRRDIHRLMDKGYKQKEIGLFLGYSDDNSTGQAAVSSFLKGSSSPGFRNRYKKYKEKEVKKKSHLFS